MRDQESRELMDCTQAQEHMAACWMGEANATEPRFGAHLASCAECRAGMARFSGLWESLGDLPAPEPSDAAASKWRSLFEGVVAAQAPVHVMPLPRRSVPQWALAAACVAAGLLAGVVWQHQAGEIASLRNQVNETRRVAALSLLRQQTAAERLRGIGYTAGLPELDPATAAALLDTIAHDSSVNVRLAAIEALNKASANAGVLASLTRALTRQESPLVQAALIDYLADARDRSAVSALRLLSQQPDLNPAVRDRTQIALRQLTQ
jgi:hypothetical protein